MYLTEVQHWDSVIKRVINIILMMASENMAFRGSSDQIFSENNGKFLKIVELLSKSDPVMKKHLNRAVENPNRTHYLGKNIQEEKIQLISKATKDKILSMIKKAKYFSIIVDCTPDNSHKEQMSIIIRYVNIVKQLDNQVISVITQESFIGFINVLDTTGLGLTEEILNSLESNNLSVMDIRGQGYDNGPNIKGKKIDVQKRIKDINSRAFYIPCVCHYLNLVVADAVQGFKSLSTTRWESHVNAVRALKLGLKEIYCAMKEVVNIEKDSITRLTAESLASKLDSFEFIWGVVVWHDVLTEINSNDANLTDEFSSISRERARKRKRFFDDEPFEEDIQPNQKFKKQFFDVLFKIAKESINERFESFSSAIEPFEFLYDIKNINKIGEDIINKCKLLEKVLTRGESKDVNLRICFWNLTCYHGN
ncbi:zinc finger MYM-type protein 1-like [Hydra vulgaris]|uniref:Zinc finger MYM-type protein 1-like n=1 Tax=Hydra vulgaris TaxID=6087 RepID=A0ABM4CLR8_HYDVU